MHVPHLTHPVPASVAEEHHMQSTALLYMLLNTGELSNDGLGTQTAGCRSRSRGHATSGQVSPGNAVR